MHEGAPSSEENSPVGRIEERFRYTMGKWPNVIEWRGNTFLLHNVLEDGTAFYDHPTGPSKGVVVVDRRGYVLRGHDEEFKDWEISETELADDGEVEKNI